ncbi:MAG TPA: NAD(P)-dependent oxidoreductase [Clostridia bacterium]
MSNAIEKNFVVDTTDQRLKTVKDLLEADGHKVQVFEQGKVYPQTPNARHIFIFPPYVPIDYKIAEVLSPGGIVFGLGCFDQEAKQILKNKNITAFFYNNDEVLLMKNAYLTAEGALAALINNTPKAIKTQKILILGYGRVGKALAGLLDDFRAKVCVATNDEREYAHASIYVHHTYTLEDFDKDLAEFDAVINTVPKLILKGERLQHIRKDAFVIDLASWPGGVDMDAAKELGLNVMHYLGVPTKTAALTAGQYLYESVKKALDKVDKRI